MQTIKDNQTLRDTKQKEKELAKTTDNRRKPPACPCIGTTRHRLQGNNTNVTKEREGKVENFCRKL